VCWHPLSELSAQCSIPSAFWASFDAGIANVQNLIQPSNPFGLTPVTDTYIYQKPIIIILKYDDKILILFNFYYQLKVILEYFNGILES